jgi:RNA polymerase sigma-70 factor (ECF subfamily)
MNTSPDFETLVEAHSAEVFAYLWRLTRSEADAQDCLQEAFVRAYRAFGRLAAGSNHRAWLYKIATNVALTHLKRSQQTAARSAALDPELAGDSPLPGERLDEAQLLEAVAAAVEMLPAQQRAALILRKYQEMPYDAVAAALGCSEAAARANVYQAIKKLRKLLVNHEHSYAR